ncbi:MAG: hypothetical protein LBH29_03625 [Elusimicrobiota bacterium]|jgi:hypothetical protein|nr:hypothetical protein [Elusimicrobiota bacterium]
MLYLKSKHSFIVRLLFFFAVLFLFSAVSFADKLGDALTKDIVAPMLQRKELQVRKTGISQSTVAITVAVLSVKGQDSTTCDIIAKSFNTALVKKATKGSLTVLDRDAIQAIEAERDKYGKSLKSLLQADYAISLSYDDVDKTYIRITANVTSVQTGKMIGAFNTTVKRKWASSFLSTNLKSIKNDPSLFRPDLRLSFQMYTYNDFYAGGLISLGGSLWRVIEGNVDVSPDGTEFEAGIFIPLSIYKDMYTGQGSETSLDSMLGIRGGLYMVNQRDGDGDNSYSRQKSKYRGVGIYVGYQQLFATRNKWGLFYNITLYWPLFSNYGYDVYTTESLGKERILYIGTQMGVLFNI